MTRKSDPWGRLSCSERLHPVLSHHKNHCAEKLLDFIYYYCLSLSLFFFFFCYSTAFGAPESGIRPKPRSRLMPQWGQHWILPPAGWGIEPASQLCRDAANPFASHQELLLFKFSYRTHILLSMFKWKNYSRDHVLVPQPKHLPTR